jgi:predicted RNA binding protein YcfA (HicA-like mRNA interferase family)
VGSKKDFQQLVKQAESQGWVVTKTNGSHLRWLSPTGRIVFSTSTPSDKRGLLNTIKELRVGGFVTLKQKNRK